MKTSVYKVFTAGKDSNHTCLSSAAVAVLFDNKLILMRLPVPSLTDSRWICSASSLVGAKISPRTPPISFEVFFVPRIVELSLDKIGITNAAVC